MGILNYEWYGTPHSSCVCAFLCMYMTEILSVSWHEQGQESYNLQQKGQITAAY